MSLISVKLWTYHPQMWTKLKFGHPFFLASEKKEESERRFTCANEAYPDAWFRINIIIVYWFFDKKYLETNRLFGSYWIDDQFLDLNYLEIQNCRVFWTNRTINLKFMKLYYITFKFIVHSIGNLQCKYLEAI